MGSGPGGTGGSEVAAPRLVRRRLTKLRLALGAVAVLLVGFLLTPAATPKAAKAPAPPEPVAPMLEAEIRRREPARAFERVQEVGREAMASTVALPAAPAAPPPPAHADFSAPAAAGPAAAAFGLLVSAEGDVLTHVSGLGGSLDPVVQLPDGTSTTSRVTAYEPVTGLVLLRLATRPPRPPRPLAAAPPRAGELAVAAFRRGGADFVLPLFVTSVGSTYGLGAAPGVAVPGTPVFNAAGEALAVAGGDPSRHEAHPAAAAVERLGRARDAGRGLPGTIGVSLQPLDEALAALLGEGGVLVADVRAGSPAERAGIRPGDVVVVVDGRPATSPQQVARRISGLRPGRPAPLVLRRQGKEQALDVEAEATLASPLETWTPPAGAAPPARAVFPEAALAAAGLTGEAAVLSVDGAAVTERTAARALRRRKPPWLAWVQQGGRRFFAAVGAPLPGEGR